MKIDEITPQEENLDSLFKIIFKKTPKLISDIEHIELLTSEEKKITEEKID